MVRSNGRESEQAPNGLSDLIPRPPVVGLEDVDELSRDQIRGRYLLTCKMHSTPQDGYKGRTPNAKCR